MKKKQIVNPFYNAANTVLNNMFQIKVERRNIELKDNIITTKKANINIGVSGDLTGSVIYSFSESMALNIAAKMAGMEMNELNELVGSAVGELANIISGNAVTNLSKNNYQCDIVPPEVILGTGKNLLITVDNIISVSMNSDLGEFDINISIENQ
ncbi:MAG: chemotaxis protein CheX [Halothermotrichaceae bacterium]